MVENRTPFRVWDKISMVLMIERLCSRILDDDRLSRYLRMCHDVFEVETDFQSHTRHGSSRSTKWCKLIIRAGSSIVAAAMSIQSKTNYVSWSCGWRLWVTSWSWCRFIVPGLECRWLDFTTKWPHFNKLNIHHLLAGKLYKVSHSDIPLLDQTFWHVCSEI